VATGIKLANNKLNVFVFCGDGDCMGEGGNHFIHAARRNHDLTVILHNNALYSLTTGQTSPTTLHGTKTKSTPFGNIDYPLPPVTMSIAAGATFVARAYAGNIPMLKDLMIKANQHKGFSVIDVLQPCVTFNKQYDHKFFQENIYDLKDHDITSKEAAFKKSLEWARLAEDGESRRASLDESRRSLKQIPVGIFYEEQKQSYEEQIPQIKEKSLVEIDNIRKNLDDLFRKYM
jgi:2-oxoglutarate/2-oxoacid ferredoxin oxidoreductase subunit beta